MTTSRSTGYTPNTSPLQPPPVRPAAPPTTATSPQTQSPSTSTYIADAAESPPTARPNSRRSTSELGLQQPSQTSATTPKPGPTLAQQLAAQPDLSQYPVEVINQLAALRSANNPRVNQALDRAALATLQGPLDLAAMSPGLAHILLTSQDPFVKTTLSNKLKSWTNDQLKQALAGKEGEDGVQQALADFQNRLVKFAETTGISGPLQEAAEAALRDNQGALEETAEKGRSFLSAVWDGISGAVEGAFNAVGGAIEKAVGAVGDVASFALDKVGDVYEAGFDVAAAGFDAVGLDGVADVTRKAGDAVDGVYDFAGEQVNGFVDGVGAGFAGMVTGVGQVIAHPVETLQGIAHLVTNPGQIPEMAKALWNEASKGGIAYAVGYIAANVAPALLSGGSSLGASTLARVGAVARHFAPAAKVIKGLEASRVVSGLAQAGGKVSSAVHNAIGGIAQRTGLTAAATRVGNTPVGQLVRKASDLKLEFNNRVDRAIAGRLEAWSPRPTVQGAIDARQAAKVSDAINLGDGEVGGVIKKRGSDGDAVYETKGADAGLPASKIELGGVEVNGGVQWGDNRLPALREGDRLRGTVDVDTGGVPGEQPHIEMVSGPLFEEKIGRQVDQIAADTSLTPQQKVEKITEVVARSLEANHTPEQVKKLTEIHNRHIDEQVALGIERADVGISTEKYLEAGMADCRGFCVLNQMALQRAGFDAGVTLSKTTLRDIGPSVPAGVIREADGLSHYYNVVMVDGKLLIADAFNPTATGFEVAQALTGGFRDRNGARAIFYSSQRRVEIYPGERAPVNHAPVGASTVAAVLPPPAESEEEQQTGLG